MILLVSTQQEIFSEFKHISLDKAIEIIKTFQDVQFDSETTGLNCHNDQILTLQFGCEAQDLQIVVVVSSYDGVIPQALKDYMNTTEQIFIIQNAKFDLQFLYKQDVWLKNVYDTMLVETILTIGLQESGRDLHTLCEKYCNVELDKTERKNLN